MEDGQKLLDELVAIKKLLMIQLVSAAADPCKENKESES